MYRQLLLAFGTVALLASSLSAADWRQFRGPDGQGASKETDLPHKWSTTENLVWKVEPGSGTSSPILVGNKIYLTSYSGFNVPGKAAGSEDDLKLHFVCLDRDTGKTLFSKDIDPKLPEQKTIRESHGYASGTPVADAERIYVSFGKSGVFAFDHAGKQLWQADIGDNLNGWGSCPSPVLYRDLVIVNASVESESLIAFDCKTGKERWRAKGIKESWNTPIFVTLPDGKTELVVAIFGKILGFDPVKGDQLWSCNTDIGWYMVPSLLSKDGVVYCVGGRTGGGLAVKAGGRGDVTSTHRVWTIKKGSNVTSPVLHEGHMYWMHENSGTAYCADLKTGDIVYEEKIDRADQVYASAVIGDGKIYYVTRMGKTIVVAAKPKFEQLSMNELGRGAGTFNASPAIADGKIYIRSDRALYCFGRK
jgi:outer membrane protein assembly factor BamB